MLVQLKKFFHESKAPTKADIHEAGWDLYACLKRPGNEEYDEDISDDYRLIIPRGERRVIPLGIATAIPVGWCCTIWDRSGMARKKGSRTLAGVIDCTYRGEWCALIHNLGEEDMVIGNGDKVCQALFMEVADVSWGIEDELPDSKRSTNGWGSTGG